MAGRPDRYKSPYKTVMQAITNGLILFLLPMGTRLFFKRRAREKVMHATIQPMLQK